MQQKDILTICLGSAIVTQNEEVLGAVAEKLAELPKATIAAIWRRLEPIVPAENAAWLREALRDAID